MRFFITYCFIFGALFAQKKGWKVDSTLAAPKTVTIETTEGSWMTLDISPDRKTIVFDLLGDIYTMPITGGEATAVALGRAWQIQPRFSPDGKRIAFVSDIDGADNIWTMKTDGSDHKQVTKERTSLPNDPIWHPTKPYMIVKRHFRNTRSLGAGEIWMYHLNSSNGMQLTKKDNFTSMAGEPAIGKDGRYIYYTRATAFDYDKDVNRTIYWMNRYDTHTGKDERYMSRQGGSVRPAISPNGKLLSFVGRKRDKTVLYLKDLESEKEWAVFDGMERDQQEAWAVFGTYPNYAWIDNNTLLIPIKGKINTLNIKTKKLTEIPFRVKATHKYTPHLMHTFNLPDTERAKVLRWAKGRGKEVTFSALGKLYQKSGSKTPKRLLDEDFRQYAPSYSRDGKRIVFASWSDKNQGAIYTMDRDGDDLRKITKKPEQYSNPVFSNNGKEIAYIRGKSIATAMNLGSQGTFEIVIYDGKRHKAIKDIGSRWSAKRMPSVYFGPKDKRIYFMVNGGGNTLLKSVDLLGNDEKTHYKSKYAEEIVPSPNFDYILFKYLHKIYATPFVDLGKTVDLKNSTGATPVVKLTDGSGDWLTWSSDSETAYWTQGEWLISAKTASFFDKKVKLDSTNISFNYQIAKPSGTLALTNARIISMNGNEVIERGTIVVKGNRITAVGANVSIPAGAKRMDMSGKTIIPGLIDVHAHMHYNTLDINPQNQWAYEANLAFGVTTTHDPSASTQASFSQSEMVKSGEMIGPRIFSTGYILYGAENTQKAPVKTYADALGHMKRLKGLGAISVKSYNQLQRKQRQMFIKAGQELNMLVMPEGGSTHHYNFNMMLDGHTGIEHNLPIAELYDDAIQFVAASDVHITPTLVVSYGGFRGEHYWYQHTNVWENEKLLRFVPRTTVDARSRRRVMVPDEEYYHFELSKTLNRLHNKGVKVNLGSHGQLQGLAAHWELWMFAQGGMSAHDVLRSGTLNGAEYLGLGSELGSLEVGKLADLVILDANPLENIRNTEKISKTMINGVLYDANSMDQVYPKKVKRKPHFFAEGAGMLQIAEGCGCSVH